ncbi:fatty acid desaturase [Chitiniphilus purpureus]|uniref:Fatty acid desaturase n=1 Tax=Chitiniphilus purpureus TaxID=2981137 RepID=A0ABY6DR98_9NEIS|nr:fatty acid desaturase [Chitiniphilus sp. CD1]UXY16238.1 fatty acid desaturase [Chitiniphilus sp. CD1]
MLHNRRDWQAVAYLVALPVLVAWQWRYGWHPFAYAVTLFLTLGIGVIHHHHTHRRMWRGRRLNRLTDLWLTLLQGHPTFVFYPAHVANHHRYRHGPRDVARTYRFGGDSNHLWGYLAHPFQAVWVLYPLFLGWLSRLRRHHPGAWRYCLLQYALVTALWAGLAWLDWRQWLLLVLIPQLHGLHWLLATNYLQHAHADGRSRLDYARNFEGWVNPLLFNIGLHTAHHEHPRVHWSELPALHRSYRARLHPALNAGPLVPYMFRTFIASVVVPRWRSRSLMRHEET